MNNELRDMTKAFQESDKRRKNAEAALSEAQSRITEDTSRIQELSSQNDKMKVGRIKKEESQGWKGKRGVGICVGEGDDEGGRRENERGRKMEDRMKGKGRECYYINLVDPLASVSN